MVNEAHDGKRVDRVLFALLLYDTGVRLPLFDGHRRLTEADGPSDDRYGTVHIDLAAIRSGAKGTLIPRVWSTREAWRKLVASCPAG